MKSIIERVAAIAGDINKARPQEVRWSICGMGLGAIVGFGGVGIAALGGAFGLSAWIALAFLFGMFGNRIGIERDKRAKEAAAKLP